MCSDSQFYQFFHSRKSIRDVGHAEYKSKSKDRLSRIATTKIKTTMIGALASIESHFSFLWEGEVSPEKVKIKEIYEIIRQEILDNGNNQIRNLKAEFDQYDIEWLRFQLTLPVRKKEDQDEEQD